MITLFKWKTLSDINTNFSDLAPHKRRNAKTIGIFMVITLLLMLRVFLKHSSFSNSLIMSIGVLMIFVIGYLATRQPKIEDSKKVWAYLILALTSVIFWTLYQIMPMGLTLFAERNVDRHFFGYLIAPQWIMNINSIVIIIGGPLLSLAFNHMRAKGMRLTIPLQFSLALIMIGAAFAILPIGIHYANAEGLTNFNWIFVSYVLQSIGELFISPIGYAMVGQLAPPRLQGLMMGTWMMTTGVAATLSDYFSNMALGATSSVDPLVTNATFSHTFGLLGWTSIAAGVVLVVFLPLVLRLTQERKMFSAQIQAVSA